ncbi:ATP-binding protein [Bacillus sp. es.034]|uniref:ATP-binding protein n=1 Tax=Bacillus sp. es.034 TaxID=1761763 RepID=UPI000BF2F8DA|nr:ATP-binding protein [Bacillus sp. es.034]PFG06179.1 alpha-ribazole kinase [Bacillus sp. es.034]
MIGNRDTLSISITDKDELIIASDCSGGIGNKPDDAVQVDPEIVGYFGFRVAVMECLSVGARLMAVQLLNFTGDSVWERYASGVRLGLSELGMDDIPLTGSSESNFNLNQSALGVTCIGMRVKEPPHVPHPSLSYALIGTPLVGEEVLIHESSIAPLDLFHTCIHHPSIVDILPVGSKGVRHELSLLVGKPLKRGDVYSTHDLDKSGGPATSFIISYNKEEEQDIRKLTGGHFQSLIVF